MVKRTCLDLMILLIELYNQMMFQSFIHLNKRVMNLIMKQYNDRLEFRSICMNIKIKLDIVRLPAESIPCSKALKDPVSRKY